MLKFQLKSGKILELNLAPIDKALSLYRAIIYECKGDKIQLDRIIKMLKSLYNSAEVQEDFSIIDVIADNKEAILSIIGSKLVMEAIQDCCEKVIYDKQKFSLELFDDEKNRPDFFGVMVVVALENLSPFFHQTPTYFTMLSAPFLM